MPSNEMNDSPGRKRRKLDVIVATEAEKAQGDENDREKGSTRSPIQLTRVKDLGAEKNVDTLGLSDILGDPLIKECWCFNFLFDIEFVLQHFDPDVRHIAKLNIIHGFWKRDDERKIALMEVAERHENVTLIPAYIPDPFGTHHSKMMILFRHDGYAQIVIHTANMIPRDWANMTQGVWRSPLLPPKQRCEAVIRQDQDKEAYPIGSGDRFKVDLMSYLNAYERKLKGLISQLVEYDFESIRAAFLGSAPSRQRPGDVDPDTKTSFGWLGLKEILSTIPVKGEQEQRYDQSGKQKPNIVIQISSIATLGQNPTWLENFQSVLSSHSSPHTLLSIDDSKTRHQKPSALSTKASEPTFNIIFPTPSEIRTSLDGYASGGSIHTKIQSPAQQKQLEYLRPLFCHWKSSSSAPTAPQSNAGLSVSKGEAYRGPAAPHIKTYIRYSGGGDGARKTINWAMLTSANLSKQAWGDVVNKKGEVWIQSWECGVVVWPELFGEQEGEDGIIMVPVFGQDTPGPGDEDRDVGMDTGVEASANGGEDEGSETEDEVDVDVNEGDGKDPDETEDETDPDETEDEVEEGEENLAAKQHKTTHMPKHTPTLVGARRQRVVGFRMPYDLPLIPYNPDEDPWCATSSYEEPDWMGRIWKGY
ncbi:phospholipase D/nuclease [Massarina eburnea CBS 473.64]|uniref:Phospholipase D/nuclease n=1 Tax=Massarina eburnea CBS 473.64 TaxID=1395130 RepID=A0A6A6RPK6_9PLEO|nr:phospholipase D/nuclease [Massarina eburnea CBS 473.64]